MKLGLLLATLLVTSTAYAGRAEIDPNIVRALDTGLIGPFQRATPVPGKATVLIELVRPADASLLERIARAGVKLTFVDGKALAYRQFVPADVTPASLAALAKMSEVARVSLAAGRPSLPLDQSAKLLRLADARGSRPDLDMLTGSGVLIADMDSMVDPFQPAFFKGDGGYYDWIDVDGDGIFTPGKDAIDLDQNGAADSSEVALALLASTDDYYGKPIPGARGADFDPGTDWLYIDTNGNGSRDYGAAGGFDDTALALGEPLFVPDDVNENGLLDVGERVVRLGTSKFRKIYVNVEVPADPATHVYTRGIDLSQAKVNISNGTLEGSPDAFHATGVNTILVGDVPLVGRRWVGIAPDAEVDVAWDVQETQNGLPVKGLTWALQDKPDVALFELAVWTGLPLDGSDVLSTMIDTAVMNDSLTATCPTGDQGSALKHAHVDLAALADTAMPFTLPAKTKGGAGPLTYVDISVNVRGGTPTSLVLESASGATLDMTAFEFGTLDGDSVYVTTQKTKRGTLFYDTILYVDTNEPALTTGVWKVHASGSATDALSIDAYVSDDKSSWAEGVAWDSSIATDAATLGIPSVADHCIAVNASPDHVGGISSAPWYDLTFYVEYNVPSGYEETQGQIRAYSPRGPRIDGVIKPDITAPDNPWVALPHVTGLAYPYGGYAVFGGTSGASPHVTGTAALLAQAGIHGDAARDAIRAGAIVDSDTGAVPNGDYGYGRLDAAGALGQKTIGADPNVTITITPAMPTTADTIQLTPVAHSNDGNDAAVQAKWDDGYDGSWDTAYAAIAPHAFSAPATGKYPFKVRVRNASGHVAESIAWITVGDPLPMMPAAASGCGCGVATSRSEVGFGASLFALALVSMRRTVGARERRTRRR